MATGMKLWTALVVVGAALVTIWKVPPSATDIREPGLPLQEEARFFALNQDLKDAQATLMRIRWADSIEALIAEKPRDGRAILITPEGLDETGSSILDEGDVSMMDEFLQERFTQLERYDPGVRYALVYQDKDHGLIPGAATDDRLRVETYVGEIDGEPYCVRVSVHGDVERDLKGDLQDIRRYRANDSYSRFVGAPDPIGTCRYYMKYGMPGSAVTNWMESGATSYAVRDVRYDRYSPKNDVYYTFARAFGYGRYLRSGNIHLEQCRAGMPEVCERMLFEPLLDQWSSRQDVEIARRSAALSIRDRWGLFAGEGHTIVSTIERDFGDEAFAAFWKADGDVADAFVEHFGMTGGEWTASWVDDEIGASPPGPFLAQTGKLSVVLVMLLAGAYTAARHTRRTVA